MTESEIIAAHCQSVLRLETADLGNQYGYSSLPLCVIDAVWSIGVRYESVQNVVYSYCADFGFQGEVAQVKHEIADSFDAMQS